MSEMVRQGRTTHGRGWTTPGVTVFLLAMVALLSAPALAASQACATETTSVTYDRSWDTIEVYTYAPNNPNDCSVTDHTNWGTVADSSMSAPYSSTVLTRV